MDLQTQKRLAASTIHQIIRTFRASLEYAIEEQKLVVNPAHRIVLPKLEKKEMRYLTTEEIERVIEASNNHRQGCLYLLAVVTGMRRCELLALKWEDIDLERGIIQVKRSLVYRNADGIGYTYKEKSPKSQSSRRCISLPAFVITALHRHRARQLEIRPGAKEWHDLGLVFPNRHGLHQAPPAMYVTYKRFLRKAGIADASFHATRHGHATSLLEMGENPRVVQERLGHSNVSVTLGIYGHVTPTMQQQTIAKLDARFGKGSQATSGS